MMRGLHVAGGLLLALVVLELSLRLGALVIRLDPTPITRHGGTILALGDSHTYGMWVPPQDAYPGQLQALLDERAPGRYNVVNLGLPGMNSSEIITRLPRWIARFRPFAVVLSIGVNNRWNWSDTSDTRRFPAMMDWFADLRLTRLYNLASIKLGQILYKPEHAERPEIATTFFSGEDARVEHRETASGELLISHRGTPLRGTHATPALRKLREDLEKIRLIAEQHHVRLVLLTYPAFDMPGRASGFTLPEVMSSIMRKFSARYDLPLVDTRDHFARLLAPGVPRAQYFASELDEHPNRSGYAEVARLVADTFEPP